MTDWLPCVGGPYDGAKLMPGDTTVSSDTIRVSVPTGKTLRVPDDEGGWEDVPVLRRGAYIRLGDKLYWEER